MIESHSIFKPELHCNFHVSDKEFRFREMKTFWKVKGTLDYPVTQNCPFLPKLPLFSISEILDKVQEDAEDVLFSLGFGQEDHKDTSRIPARFFTNPSQARGIDFQLFLKAQVQRIEMEDPCLMLASECSHRSMLCLSLRLQTGINESKSYFLLISFTWSLVSCAYFLLCCLQWRWTLTPASVFWNTLQETSHHPCFL